MKQSISHDQWLQLDQEQQKKFWKTDEPADNVVPSLVDLIECLSQDHSVQIIQTIEAWWVGLDVISDEDLYYANEQPQLCDALWNCVKRVIQS